VLAGYFPTPLRERFSEQMAKHRLRREIVTTTLVNEAVNRGGLGPFFTAGAELNANSHEMLRAYMLVRELFDLHGFWRDLGELDGGNRNLAAQAIAIEGQRFLEIAIRWVLRQHPRPSYPKDLDVLKEGIDQALPHFAEWLGRAERSEALVRKERFLSLGSPDRIADKAAYLIYYPKLLDIVRLASRSGRNVAEVGWAYSALYQRLNCAGIQAQVSQLSPADPWTASVKTSLQDQLFESALDLTAEVMTEAEIAQVKSQSLGWEQFESPVITRIHEALNEFGEPRPDLAGLAMLLGKIRTLIRIAPPP